MGESRPVPAWLSPALSSASCNDQSPAAAGAYERIGRLVAALLAGDDYLYLTRIDDLEGDHDGFAATGGVGGVKHIGRRTLTETLEALSGLAGTFSCAKCGRSELIGSSMAGRPGSVTPNRLCKHCDRERSKSYYADVIKAQVAAKS